MRTAIISLATFVSTLMVAAAQQPSSTSPKVRPNLIPQQMAMRPAPSANAREKTQKNSVGKGALTVTTEQPVDFWQEQIPFSGRGVVTTDFLYDPNIGVLFGYRQDDFKCVNGQPAYGGILEALYTEANHANKPAGSGWYAVELETGKCAAKKSGVYGCKFDASGNATECGTATLNSHTGQLNIAAAE